MIFELIKTYWAQTGFILSVIWSVFMYISNKTKRKQDFKIGENQIIAGDISNLSAIIKLQRETLEDVRKEFDILKADYKERGLAYDKLEKKFNKVSATLDAYDKKIKSLYAENLELIEHAKQCDCD